MRAEKQKNVGHSPISKFIWVAATLLLATTVASADTRTYPILNETSADYVALHASHDVREITSEHDHHLQQQTEQEDENSPTMVVPASNQNVNQRSGPGTNYAIADVLQAGEHAEVVAISEDGEWYLLANGNWVAAFTVTAQSGDFASLPIASDDGVFQPSATEPSGDSNAEDEETTEAGSNDGEYVSLENLPVSERTFIVDTNWLPFWQYDGLEDSDDYTQYGTEIRFRGEREIIVVGIDLDGGDLNNNGETAWLRVRVTPHEGDETEDPNQEYYIYGGANSVRTIEGILTLIDIAAEIHTGTSTEVSANDASLRSELDTEYPETFPSLSQEPVRPFDSYPEENIHYGYAGDVDSQGNPRLTPIDELRFGTDQLTVQEVLAQLDVNSNRLIAGFVDSDPNNPIFVAADSFQIGPVNEQFQDSTNADRFFAMSVFCVGYYEYQYNGNVHVNLILAHPSPQGHLSVFAVGLVDSDWTSYSTVTHLPHNNNQPNSLDRNEYRGFSTGDRLLEDIMWFGNRETNLFPGSPARDVVNFLRGDSEGGALGHFLPGEQGLIVFGVGGDLRGIEDYGYDRIAESFIDPMIEQGYGEASHPLLGSMPINKLIIH